MIPSGIVQSLKIEKVRWSIIIFAVILIFFWNDGLKLKMFDLSAGGKTEWSKYYVIFALLISILAIRIFNMHSIGKSWYLKSLIILCLIIIFPILVTSIGIYNQPISVLWRRTFLFGGYLILPFLMVLNLTKKEIIILFSLIMLVPMIGILLCFFGYLFPEIFNWFVDWEVSVRFDMVRLNIAPNFTKLLLFFLIALIINSKNKMKKILYLVLIFMLFWVIINVWLTRQIVYAILAGLGFILLIRIPTRQKIIFSFVVLFVISTVVFITDYDINFKVLLKNISLMNELTLTELKTETGSLGQRLFALDYFFKQFVKTNLIGIGMNVSDGMDNPITFGGLYYKYNTNDLGLLGMIFHFGLPVPFFIFFMFRRLYHDLSKVISNSDTKIRTIANGIFMFLIVEIVGLIFTKAFFHPHFSLFYGLIIYFTWRLTQPDIISTTAYKAVSLSVSNKESNFKDGKNELLINSTT